MEKLLRKLEGGDRRSIGRVDEVIADVLNNPSLFDVLFDAMLGDDPIIRMRSADAVEKITARHPEYLQPFKAKLLQQVATSEQQELRWHVAQMIPRLDLSAEERRAAVEILLDYLDDKSKIVKTFSMQALADLAEEDASLRPQVIALLEELSNTGSPAMKNRGQKLLKKLSPLILVIALLVGCPCALWPASPAPTPPPASAPTSVAPQTPPPAVAPTEAKAPASETEVLTSVDYDYYQINGSTADELRAQMDELGPTDEFGHHYDAYTAWRVSWSYPYATGDNNCAIGPMELRVEVTFTFPQWDIPADASQELMDRWDAYMAALQLHEDGHKETAVEAGYEILRTLSALPDYPSCDELEMVADATGEGVLDWYRHQEDIYDRDTDHGATQGARFP